MNTAIIRDFSELRSREFAKEKNLSEYIETHMAEFCRDVLSDAYVSHESEVQQSGLACFGPRAPRVDYKIVCQSKTYLVELKNPKNISENRSAIGQILSYSVLLDPHNEYDLVIVTTGFDILTAKAIHKFNLPIRYVYLDKDRMAEYLGDEE